jgi:hypothetical protein
MKQKYQFKTLADQIKKILEIKKKEMHIQTRLKSRILQPGSIKAQPTKKWVDQEYWIINNPCHPHHKAYMAQAIALKADGLNQIDKKIIGALEIAGINSEAAIKDFNLKLCVILNNIYIESLKNLLLG